MNVKEWAERLNWREYREEMTAVEEKQAEEDGMVIVFGASDDLIEFRGVIRDELGAGDGGVYKMTAAKDVVPVTDHSADMHRALPSVRAVWSPQTIDLDVWASWEITTDIPHETFDILEDGELYCRGVVFAWVDAFPKKEVEVDESLYPVDRPVEPANRWENPEQWAYIADWEENRADRAEAALNRAVEALKWYAEGMNYFPRNIVLECQNKGIRLAPIYSEFGKRARVALGILPEKGEVRPREDHDIQYPGRLCPLDGSMRMPPTTARCNINPSPCSLCETKNDPLAPANACGHCGPPAWEEFREDETGKPYEPEAKEAPDA